MARFSVPKAKPCLRVELAVPASLYPRIFSVKDEGQKISDRANPNPEPIIVRPRPLGLGIFYPGSFTVFPIPVDGVRRDGDWKGNSRLQHESRAEKRC
jgi:hypothetical protein